MVNTVIQSNDLITILYYVQPIIGRDRYRKLWNTINVQRCYYYYTNIFVHVGTRKYLCIIVFKIISVSLYIQMQRAFVVLIVFK